MDSVLELVTCSQAYLGVIVPRPPPLGHGLKIKRHTLS